MPAPLRGALVPHAPLLIPDLASAEVAEAAGSIRAAVASIDLEGIDLVVVASPHGARTAVYAGARGSLSGFSIPGVTAGWASDRDAAEKVSISARLPLTTDAPDHGCVVPALLRRWGRPILPLAFDESAEPDPACVRRVADALLLLSSECSMLVVASANGAAGLTPRAPFPSLPDAPAWEDSLREACELEVGALRSVSETAASVRSCSSGPLLLLAELFAGRKGRVLCHERPVGVGYTVAEIA